MAELSTVRASGFRQSVQFDFSVKPGGSAVTMLLEPCGECMALVSLPSQSQEATHFFWASLRCSPLLTSDGSVFAAASC